MRRVSATLVLATALLTIGPAALAAAPSLAGVLQHTRAAETALVKAVAAFDQHALGKGRVALSTNRSEIGAAVADTAKLIKDATTPAERLAAAKALVAVARQAGRDEHGLAGSVGALARGTSLQLRVAGAANADAHRTASAVAKLQQLAGGLPDQAQEGIATALAQLTLSRGHASAIETTDVTDHGVGAGAKAAVAGALAADIHGQQLAIDLLQALRAELPAHAQNGIDTALAAIAKSLSGQAQTLAGATAHAPASLRPSLRASIQAAKNAAADAKSS
jgi:hypothetical protein